MTGARLVEVRGRALGLVVGLAPDGFRFFSSGPDADALDGLTFPSVSAAVSAAERLAPPAAAALPAAASATPSFRRISA